jgi:hypothetical protein
MYAIPYKIPKFSYTVMINDKKLFERVWVSSDYQTVFCCEEDKERYLSFLSSRKEIPRGMSIVLIEKRLTKPYTRDEIMKATPEQLKSMIK